MSREVERLEVYLDEETVPLRILLRPPFKFHLDTRALPRGRHLLRVVSVFADNRRREERSIPFDSTEVPLIVFEGLGGGPRSRPKPGSPGRPWWLALTLALALGAWALTSEPEPERSSAELLRQSQPKEGGRVALLQRCSPCHAGATIRGGIELPARFRGAGALPHFSSWLDEHLIEGGSGSLSPEEIESLFFWLRGAGADGSPAPAAQPAEPGAQ